MKDHINTFSSPCSGCGACVTICPKDAITVNLDIEGFYTAMVDESSCVSCGMCKKVCMRNKIHGGTPLRNGVVVAAQSSDASTVKECTSGGIAFEMSKFAFDNGRGVLGVIYNYDTNRAESRVAYTKEDIELFRGSKYIQSYTVDAFKEMIEDMKSNLNRKYLAFGTPCQIYGLASVLENLKMRDRAILVDLFCHGVPSYLVWNKYLDSLKEKIDTKQITKVVFRDKSIGWHNFVIKLSSSSGTYMESSEGDLFYHAFFDNVLFSKACFDCSVRKDISKADIRLGDYWGKKYQDKEDGVSAILLFTDRGRDFLTQINDKLFFYEAEKTDDVLKSQSIYAYGTSKYRYNAFMELKQGTSLQKTIKSYRKLFPIKKRIKLFIKEGTAKLPDDVRATIRKIYKKI